jgi:HK97 family phage prohead protease
MNRTIKGYVKGMEAEDGQRVARFVASTAGVDRHGDIVEQTWDLGAYMKNPVILQNHDYHAPVVGMATRAVVEDGALVIDVLFDTSDHNPDGRRLADQVARGFVRAVSVGFRPSTVTPRSSLPEGDPRKADRGYVLGGNELLELSIVSVPANAEALAAKGLAGPTIDEIVARVRAEIEADARAEASQDWWDE